MINKIIEDYLIKLALFLSPTCDDTIFIRYDETPVKRLIDINVIVKNFHGNLHEDRLHETFSDEKRYCCNCISVWLRNLDL